MQMGISLVKMAERSEFNRLNGHHRPKELCMRMSVFNLLHYVLIKNLLTLCSGTGDCEGCKGEALLCGFRF